VTKRICTICARGGSKGLKNKNLLPILGKPLIAHTISQAHRSELFDAVAVTSDSKAILEAAQKNGAEHLVRRPDELATDTASIIPVIQHCVQEIEKKMGCTFNTIVDLPTTSPLRLVSEIQQSIERFENSDATNLITGTIARGSPYYNVAELDEDGMVQLSKPSGKTFFRRQDAPKCYKINGAVYIWRRPILFQRTDTIFHERTALFEMPEERSFDIDSELDFSIVNMLATKRGEL
jgi:CMP-N,N'-diacetyllegionaminic acid synthase